MLIRDHMTQPVHTVRPLDSIRHARAIMEDRRVNQLPVIVGGRVVGIVTDRDLRDAFPSVFDAAASTWAHKNGHADVDPGIIPVEIVMTPHVLTVQPGDSLADAARLLHRERIGAIPVVDHGRLVGIITRSDVLKAFVESDALHARLDANLMHGAVAGSLGAMA